MEGGSSMAMKGFHGHERGSSHGHERGEFFLSPFFDVCPLDWQPLK